MGRRKKKELEALVDEADYLMQEEGMTKTAACDRVKLGIATYNNLTGGAVDKAPSSKEDALARALTDFKNAAARLRELGVTFTISDIVIPGADI